jgi:hypothetical protein
VLEDPTSGIDRLGRHLSSCLRMSSVREDSGPLPAIVLVFLSFKLLVACCLMSQAPQPTEPGIESSAAFGIPSCTSYVGTTFDCP